MATFEEFTSQFGNMSAQNDPSSVFSRFLDANPQATFFGTLPRNMTPVQRQASGDVYNQAIQDYYGELGRRIQQGQAPTLQFQQYLQEFPYTQRFAQATQRSRDMARQRISPRTRRLFYG
tara:strand:+ start:18237 stop:18596 length:360 start_codon:yes stop_codon:yes gene_type:complete